MKQLSDTESSTQSSLDDVDFNSEDAFCEGISYGEGLSEVEILGMNLLTLNEEGTTSHYIDESESDLSEEHNDCMIKQTADSLELTRKRLPHLVVHGGRAGSKKSKPRRLYKETLPGGEVDSLVLTRERNPHLIHKADRVARLRQLYEEGRGLFGEVDSLDLDKKRLPHLVHKRREVEKSTNPTISKASTAHPLQEVDGVGLNDASNDMEVVTFMKLSGESDDSTSTTESSTSNCDSVFSSDTVDSLILARRRLATDTSRKNETEQFESDQFERNRSYNKPQWHQRPDDRKLPPKPGVGLGSGLRRTSSGACAA